MRTIMFQLYMASTVSPVLMLLLLLFRRLAALWTITPCLVKMSMSEIICAYPPCLAGDGDSGHWVRQQGRKEKEQKSRCKSLRVQGLGFRVLLVRRTAAAWPCAHGKRFFHWWFVHAQPYLLQVLRLHLSACMRSRHLQSWKSWTIDAAHLQSNRKGTWKQAG